MTIIDSSYGPFAPVVGYAGAIMAAGGALFTLFGRRMKKWRPPDENLPGTAQAVVLLMAGVGMVVMWYFATPANIRWFVGGLLGLLLITAFALLRYQRLLGLYRYDRVVAISEEKTRTDYLLGGRELLPEVEKMRQKKNLTIQRLLEGALYDPDRLWSRDSREWVKSRVLTFFMLTVVMGTWALTAASFTVQVLLTQRSAQSVIRKEDAPGLNR